MAVKVAQNQELLQKINRTSNNSSSPPSADPLNVEKAQKKNKSGKKRGGQRGHKGHSRFYGNVDGCNPNQSQGWLWVAVTPLFTFFQITLSRCSDATRNLSGEGFSGILNSDRHGAYNWVGIGQRQLCWAHLRREFIKISERTGVSAEIKL